MTTLVDPRPRSDAEMPEAPVRAPVGRGQAAIAGIVAAAAALATGEAFAGIFSRTPSLLVAVGDIVVDRAPGDVVRFGIDTFGRNDKPALLWGILAVSLAVAALTAEVARSRSRRAVALCTFAAFGLVGAWAAARYPSARTVPSVLSALTSAAVGGALLLRLLASGPWRPATSAARATTSGPATRDTAMAEAADSAGFARSTSPRSTSAGSTSASAAGPGAGSDDTDGERTAATAGGEQPVTPAPPLAAAPAAANGRPRPLADPRNPPASRRSFLAWAGAGTAFAGVAAVGGRQLQRRSEVESARAQVQLPAAATMQPAADGTFDGSVPGLSRYLTPNGDFYRIDTALLVPEVDPTTWKMSITGMVDHPIELNYDQLLALPMVEHEVTLSCVSNEVGGDLVGNARWQGVLLADLLRQAGVQPDASQVVGRSVDGFTAGFPTAVAVDGRKALVAVAMNGEPLPVRHGFPARLVVPGLYGYVSATKWLKEIELTRLEDFDGYWVPRGWSKEAPIKTQSRIDVPPTGSHFPPSRLPIAGVAWAPVRGIAKVEVRIDDGPWQEARIGGSSGPDTWVQWVLPWDAPRGAHTIAVRATDGLGQVQTDEEARPDPDGATGYHTIEVEVR